MIGANEILDSLLAWATRDPNVRRLVLVGSRARAVPPDDLADIDVQVYVGTGEPYTQNHEWLSAIGRVWVCVPDEYADGDVQVPTRLVIFERGVKVDFAFYPAGRISNGISAGLPYRVLLDEDEPRLPLAIQPAPPREVPHERDVPRESAAPGAQAFRRVVEEFWFEMYHVAKYLARNDLWRARSRDWATMQFLLTLVDWHERVVRGKVHEGDYAGERRCVSPDTWQALHQTFGAFEREASWSAALATMHLFRRLAEELAAAVGLTYPADLDRNISGFVLGLRDGLRARMPDDGGPEPTP